MGRGRIIGAMSSDGPVYIITGGAGFIGSSLVAMLQRDEPEARLYVIDDFSTGSYANIVEACERLGAGVFRGTVMADPVGELNLQPAIVGMKPKAVFHLAAITDTLVTDERKMISVNSEPFEEIVDACLESDVPLVYASSAAVYGSPDTRDAFTEDLAGRPNNVYGFSKWLMDVTAQRAIEEAGGEGHVVGLRYFNVFGPGEARKGRMASMVYHLTMQMLRGERPRLFEHGHHERDQVFVDDIVSGTITAAKPGAESGIYNLGSGKATSFNDIAHAVNTGLGTSLEVEYIPMPDEMVSTYQHYTRADLTSTTRALSWEPSHDPVESMISYARMIADGARRTAATS